MKKINWDGLYRTNAPFLTGMCRRYTGDEAVARDLVQDTFVTAIEKIEEYKGKGSIEGWIRKIAVNKALMYLRSLKFNEIPADKIYQSVKSEIKMETSENKIRYAIEEASFTTGELLEVIDVLPLHHKTVFNLYVIDGYKHKQIAQLLGISQGTSKSHLARARKKAQELLYARALEKEPEERRRYRLFFLLFLFPNRIDSLFRKKFKDYKLAASPPAPVDIVSPVLHIQKGTTLVGKAIICCSVVATFFAGGFFISRYVKNNQPAREGLPVVISPFNADTIAGNEIDTTANTETVPADTLTETKAEEAPVIIQKTIVIRDTVYLEKPDPK